MIGHFWEEPLLDFARDLDFAVQALAMRQLHRDGSHEVCISRARPVCVATDLSRRTSEPCTVLRTVGTREIKPRSLSRRQREQQFGMESGRVPRSSSLIPSSR